ncbi:MAG: indolepyruvate ferredoxin oxidoreductase subunit alpha [Kiritimatiellae bacterium]|nr:indolepyruvate ferredoxin oxidoreductase subunit alpha [Kiritimatiellia bacterium]
MHKEFLMGNAAIAKGAVAAGVRFAAGYPGTPSTETLENVAKFSPPSGERGVHVEWSVNETAALEAAAGASYAGARSLVTMKQMGLNVASDPLMCLAYIGVKGGMVVMVADDPGPISSQTEQDTRRFASHAKIPCFDPSSVQEAYDMVRAAFELSEARGTPVFLRPTTRVCHAYSVVEVLDDEELPPPVAPEGFVKDSQRWVIFPGLSYRNHEKLVRRNEELSAELSDSPFNAVVAARGARFGRLGLVAGGISWALALDELDRRTETPRLFKVGTPYPFPEKAALAFLEGLDIVLCLEELDSVLEEELLKVVGKHHLPVKIIGRLTRTTRVNGENTVELVKAYLRDFLADGEVSCGTVEPPVPPPLPMRPPVLCAGCPHRASFYAVKQAMKGKKSLFCGDIGCYTLGNARPLDMVDTCLCMGAGIALAQGVWRVEPDTTCFAFVGDSTFFASALTGIVNAVYSGADLTVVVLDNSTTAMTGHQPHPGTGRTIRGDVAPRVSIEGILRGIGLATVETVDPLDLPAAVATVRRVAAEPGVKAIVFRSPCAVLAKPGPALRVDPDRCIGCGRCAKELGCPALSLRERPDSGRKLAVIDETQCNGCGLCAGLCPVGAIGKGEQQA